MSRAPNQDYDELVEKARRLDIVEQLRLLEALAAMVRRNVGDDGGRRVLELRGLGKDLWRDLGAQEYVDRERAPRDGQMIREARS